MTGEQRQTLIEQIRHGYVVGQAEDRIDDMGAAIILLLEENESLHARVQAMEVLR